MYEIKKEYMDKKDPMTEWVRKVHEYLTIDYNKYKKSFK